MTKFALLFPVALALAGCASMAPELPAAQSGVPPAVTMPGRPGVAAATQALPWQQVFTDEAMQRVIGMALEGNRSLRVTVQQVAQARAAYGIQRAAQLPAIGAQFAGTRTGTDAGVTQQWTAGVGLSAFEIDLFGRVQSLSESALQSWLAQDETRASAELALVAETANAWLTLAADRSRLALARATLATQTQTLELAQRRHSAGAISGLDLAQVQTQAATAQADAAAYERAAAADRLALDLLAGGPVPEEWLPEGLTERVRGLPAPPAGLASDVLLQRPDVRAAEHGLRAANAQIGAARAAFFPSITLTGTVGTASAELSGLFKSGSGMWQFIPQVNLPLFSGGRLQANLDATEAAQAAALASYEQAIQAAFADTAGALTQIATLGEQRAAQETLVQAATRADELADARWRAGRDSQLTRLDAQRTRYAAEQALIATQLAEQGARVSLYRALGGGWVAP